MKTSLLLTLALWVVSTCNIQAGGPPPMYVVVTKVVLQPAGKTPGTIQIWGFFTRDVKTKDAQGKDQYGYTKPQYGFVFLELKDTSDAKLREEISDWQSAVGSSRAVSVGSCGDGGCMLACPIHSASETVAKPDAVYTTGRLRTFGTLYAEDWVAKQEAVIALVEYAKQHKTEVK